MRNMAVVVIVALCSVLAVAQRKIAEDDPRWRQQTVQRAFSEVSAGLRTSWSEKYLARLGDSAAPEIMSCITSKNLTAKDAETALSLVKMSFANPRLIRRSPNETPTKTLALLDYLDERVSDADIRAKISSMRDQLQNHHWGHN